MKIGELVEKCKEGDPKYWGMLVKHFYNFVYFLAEKWLIPSLVDQETVKDVVFNTFAKLYESNREKLKKYKPGTLFPVFLRSTVLEEVKKCCRKNKIEFKFSANIDLGKLPDGSSEKEIIGLKMAGNWNLAISDAAKMSGVPTGRIHELLDAVRVSSSSGDPGTDALELKEDSTDAPPGTSTDIM